MSPRFWEIVSWMSAACTFFAAGAMINPQVAATAYTPWILYITGNILWFADSIRSRRWPWATLSFVFILLNVLTLAARTAGTSFFEHIQPIITIMENLP